MKKSKLNEIPTEFLSVVETTSDKSGYPKDIEYAVTGFDTFEDAQAYADENELELIWLHKRNGQQFYNRGDKAYKPLTIKPEDFGDGCVFYDDEEVFMEDVRSFISDMANSECSLNDFETFIAEAKEIVEALEQRDISEVVIVDNGLYYDTQKLHPIEWHYYTHHTILAAI